MAVPPPAPITGVTPLSIRWPIRLVVYVIVWHDWSSYLPTLCFWSRLKSSCLSESPDETAQLRKRKKKSKCQQTEIKQGLQRKSCVNSLGPNIFVVLQILFPYLDSWEYFLCPKITILCWGLEFADGISCGGVIHLSNGVAIKCILWLVFSSGDLESLEYTAITPRSTLTWSGKMG